MAKDNRDWDMVYRSELTMVRTGHGEGSDGKNNPKTTVEWIGHWRNVCCRMLYT